MNGRNVAYGETVDADCFGVLLSGLWGRVTGVRGRY